MLTQITRYYLGWMDSHVDCGSVGLFTLNSFDVNYKFFTVTLNNLSYLLTFVVASEDLNFIVLTNWHCSATGFMFMKRRNVTTN